MKRVLLIGDIHGCFDELVELIELAWVHHGEPRHIVSLGDVVDRGPESGKCVAHLRALGATVILGNHEEKHLRYRRKTKDGTASNMQMAEHHLLSQQQVSSEDWDWLQEASIPFLRLPEYKVVALHAGLHAGISPEDMPEDRICRVQTTRPGASHKSPWANWGTANGMPQLVGKTWEKAKLQGYQWWTEFLDDDWTYVYGHTVFEQPMATYRTAKAFDVPPVIHKYIDDPNLPYLRLIPQALGIDTGVPFGGSLTGLLLPEWQLISVPAKKIYYGTKKLDPNYEGVDDLPHQG